MRRTLAVLAKAPIPGRVNTCLCPPLGPQTAAQLHEAFVLDVMEKAALVPDAELVVAYTPAGTRDFFEDAAPCARSFLLQRGRDVGERTFYCFERLCEPGRLVVALGTNIPTLHVRCLELAFDALGSGEVDVVFGPANDGGCYLIGMTEKHPELFQGIRWRVSNALGRSIERAAELGLDWFLLPEWHEIARPADLAYLREELLDSWARDHSARHTRACLRSLIECGMV